MTHECQRLHELVLSLSEVRWPFGPSDLPQNGMYFFTEKGEKWGHGGANPRIVRVGTHREGNFRSRMADHYVSDERKMDFGRGRAAPKDRSIFRKNIGRALLHRDNDSYLPTWEIDFTTRAARESFASARDVEKERAIEREVSRVLRGSFAFRWIAVSGQERRMGSEGLERALIGTLASCRDCGPSSAWLGLSSPKPKIVSSGLWLEQHLRNQGLSTNTLDTLEPMFKAGSQRP